MPYTLLKNFDEAKDLNLEKFKNFEFDFPLEIYPTNVSNINLLFVDCKFNFDIKIKNIIIPNFNISFINCKFTDNIEIVNNIIEDIKLIWHFDNNKPNNCHINSYLKKKKINISSNEIRGFCKITGLNHHLGRFSFIANVFSKQPREVHSKRKTDYPICIINNNNITNPSIHGNTFYMPFEFLSNNLKYNEKYSGHYFQNNLFQKSDFSNTNFGEYATFHDSKFYSTTLFIDCKNISNTKMIFSSCEFKGFTLFDKSKFKHLEIKHTIFEKKTSFEQIEIENLKLHQVSFFQGAFFDEINIKNIKNENYLKSLKNKDARELRRTLRSVKQELQKAENRIDYNRFRGYELQAHYQELDWENNFKDKAILWATKISTGFEYSWTKALEFILIVPTIFYILFFISENYAYQFDCRHFPEFLTGYFRFLIVTDFYNPLEKKRIFIDNSNTISWLIFIVGKIVLAFGIYEMIQAFRKFKA
ncbi:hypothetical protein [Flavobacterium beibuense]|uniref:hypothetical protein n=1 Tax=Flavobacterium beibuense TaxID=657326 RepID=UPI003A8D7ECF